jgi:hypothetical protein
MIFHRLFLATLGLTLATVTACTSPTPESEEVGADNSELQAGSSGTLRNGTRTFKNRSAVYMRLTLTAPAEASPAFAFVDGVLQRIDPSFKVFLWPGASVTVSTSEKVSFLLEKNTRSPMNHYDTRFGPQLGLCEYRLGPPCFTGTMVYVRNSITKGGEPLSDRCSEYSELDKERVRASQIDCNRHGHSEQDVFDELNRIE